MPFTAEVGEFARNPNLASYTVVITYEEERKIAIISWIIYRKTPKQEI